MLPRLLDVGRLKVVDRELHFIRQAHIAILHFAARLRIARPHDIVNRVDVLQKRRDSFEAISELC